MRHDPLTALGGLLLLAAAGAAASAELASTLDDQREVAVTIYNNDLALVRDRREATLPAGASRLAWREVSARLQPETALLRDLDHPEGFRVREQNFDFDLLTPATLLEKYVGRQVEVVRTHPTTGAETREAAEVLSVADGVVLRLGDRIETGVPGRLVFPDVPGNLRERPTLVLDLESGAAGARRLELAYLTGGLSWQADYVAELNGADDALDLNGWVTLTNTSGAGYRDARLQLVAGDVNRVAPERDLQPRRTLAMAAAPAPEMAEEALFEYHLYSLERPTTLADNQTKQVALLGAERIPARKEYLLEGQPYYYRGGYGQIGDKLKPAVYLEFDNRVAAGLGLPLPRGVIRIYKQDSRGQPQFVGEDRIDHTPRDETVRLRLGQAFDITAERVQTDYRRLPGRSKEEQVFETAFRLTLRNAKEEAVTVKVREPVPGDWTLVEESHPHTRTAAHTAEWSLPVPARGEAVLTYRVRSR